MGHQRIPITAKPPQIHLAGNLGLGAKLTCLGQPRRRLAQLAGQGPAPPAQHDMQWRLFTPPRPAKTRGDQPRYLIGHGADILECLCLTCHCDRIGGMVAAGQTL